MPLKPDNPDHRSASQWLDEKCTGNSVYDKVARPLGHAAYHAVRSTDGNAWDEAGRAIKDAMTNYGRCVDEDFKDSPNLEPGARVFKDLGTAATKTAEALSNIDREEIARAKDQLSKVGNGQQRTEYLKAHREKEAVVKEKEQGSSSDRECDIM